MEKSNIIQFPERPDPYLTAWNAHQTADIICLPISSEQEFQAAFDNDVASEKFYQQIKSKIEHLNLDSATEAAWFETSIFEDYLEHAKNHGIRVALEHINAKLDSMSRHPALRGKINPPTNPS